MSEFKVGDRVRIKKNDIVGCIYEMTILENRGFGLDVTYYEMKYIYSVISEDRVYINLKEEDLDLIEKFKDPTPLDQLEQRIKKLESFFDVVDMPKPSDIFRANKELPFQKPSLLTEDERVILRSIPKKYNWIVRDKDWDLYVFEERPFRNDYNYWSSSKLTDGEYLGLFFNSMFMGIERERPHNIEELLKGECGNE